MGHVTSDKLRSEKRSQNGENLFDREVKKIGVVPGIGIRNRDELPTLPACTSNWLRYVRTVLRTTYVSPLLQVGLEENLSVFTC